MTTEKTGTFPDAHGVEIFWRRIDAAAPRAALVVCHGLGEHSGRYVELMNELAVAGVSCLAMDHKGHGKSGGKRGHVNAFDEFTYSVRHLVETAHAEYGARKVYLFGHSMGGVIAADYALRFPESIAGLVLEGAAFKIVVTVPRAKELAGRIMSQAWPGLTLGNEIPPEDLSRDPNEVAAYVADPLVHDRISARLYTEIVATAERAMARAGALTMPLLITNGGDDPIVDPEGAREFHGRVSSADKTLTILDGMLHEPLHEIDKARAIAQIRDWILTRA
ncbi:lysophospholipase [bacterium]|nr:lysophospholipase [bacterium]